VILAEPPRTQYDVNFMLAGVPVRVHPLFWLVTLLLGLPRDASVDAGGPAPAVMVIIWVLAMFVSILVHEMGHAFAIRYFGWQPRVVLWQLGGLALWDSSESYTYNYNPNEESPRAKILIAVAGPAAGFVLAALVVGLCYATRHPVTLSFGGPLGFEWDVQGFSNLKALYLVHYMLFINVFWGLVNLLPVFPLDGGQISREVFTSLNRYEGVPRSLRLSAVVGAVVAILALLRLENLWDGLFVALMFGYLAYVSYTMLQAYRSGGYGGYAGYGEDDRPW
jgi:stage IV sporulation protein FB